MTTEEYVLAEMYDEIFMFFLISKKKSKPFEKGKEANTQTTKLLSRYV